MTTEQECTIVLGVTAGGTPHVLKSRTGNLEMPYGLEDFIEAMDDLHLGVLLHLTQRRIAAKGIDKCPGSSSHSPSLSLTPG